MPKYEQKDRSTLSIPLPNNISYVCGLQLSNFKNPDLVISLAQKGSIYAISKYGARAKDRSKQVDWLPDCAI